MPISNPPDPILVPYVPVSTVASAWTTVGAASAHLAIDDAQAAYDEDVTHISSGTTGQQVEVGFQSDIQDPGSDDGHQVIVRLRRTGGSSTALLTIELRSAASTVATLTGIGMTGSYQDVTWTLSAGEAAGIPDYSSLTVRLTSETVSAGEEVRVTALFLAFLTGIETRATRTVLRCSATTTLGARATRAALRTSNTPATPFARATRAALRTSGAFAIQARATRAAIRCGGVGPLIARVTRAVLRVSGLNVYGVSVVPGALPSPVVNLLPANWIEPVKLTCAWSTDVFSAESVSEDRSSLVDRPYRILQQRVSGMFLQEAGRTAMNAHRFLMGRQIVGLACDASRVTQSSSGTTVWCDTRFRRFFFGARVVVYKADSSGRPSSPHYATITAIFSDRLTLSLALPSTYPIGSRVLPVMDVEISLDQLLDVVTDEVNQVDLELREVTGKSALLSSAQALPSGIQVTGDDVPIFNPRVEWSSGFQLSVERQGDQEESGRDVIITTRGDRPLRQYSTGFESRTREEAWQVVQFFDYCRGRGRTFYVLAPESPLELVAITDTKATVIASGNIQDVQDFVQALGIRKTDGTLIVAEVTSIIDVGGMWNISYAGIGGIDLGQVQKFTTAHLVRFETDEMEETWETIERMTTTLRYVEVLREQDTAVSDLNDPGNPIVPDPETIANLYLVLDSRINAWKTIYGTTGSVTHDRQLGLALVHGDPIGLWDDSRAVTGVASDPGAQGESTGAYVVPNHNGAGVTCFYPDPQVNLGRPSVCMIPSQGGGGSSNVQRTFLLNSTFFDTSLGFTYICHAQFPAGAEWNADYAFLWQDGVIECENGVVRIFTTLDSINTALHITALPSLNSRAAHVVVITWSPSNYLRFIRDGFISGTGPSVVASTMPVNTSRPLNLFYGVSDVLADPRRSVGVNWIGLYSRALSSSEINDVAHFLVNEFGGRWTDL